MTKHTHVYRIRIPDILSRQLDCNTLVVPKMFLAKRNCEPASQATNPINQTRYVWVEIRKPTVEEFAAHLRLKGSG